MQSITKQYFLGDGTGLGLESSLVQPMGLIPGPNFIELLKQEIMLNNFHLSKKERDTSHNFYKWHGIVGWLPRSGNHNYFVLSYFLCAYVGPRSVRFTHPPSASAKAATSLKKNLVEKT